MSSTRRRAPSRGGVSTASAGLPKPTGDVGAVVLPSGFKVATADAEGETLFTFSSPVELPFGAKSLADYSAKFREELASTTYWPEYLSFPNDSKGFVVGLVCRILEETMPEFFGESDFYNQGKVHLAHWFELQRAVNWQKIAWLSVRVDSDTKLGFRLESEKVVVPSVNGGSVSGYVPISAKIQSRKEEVGGWTYIHYYDQPVSPAILTALAYGPELSLERQIVSNIDNRVFRTDFATNDRVIYVRISHPNIDRIKGAVQCAADVEEFLRAHGQSLQAVAQTVNEAYGLVRHRQKLRQAYEEVLKMHGEAERRIGGLPRPGSIDETVRAVEAAVALKLREPDEALQELSQNFPRELLHYVMPQ